MLFTENASSPQDKDTNKLPYSEEVRKLQTVQEVADFLWQSAKRIEVGILYEYEDVRILKHLSMVLQNSLNETEVLIDDMLVKAAQKPTMVEELIEEIGGEFTEESFPGYR